MSLIVLNVGIFIYLYYFSPNPTQLIKQYSFVPSLFWSGSWSPLDNYSKFISLFSAQFIHGSVLHLAGNMIFLFVFGDNVEDKMGHTRYLFFYLICGAISMIVHAYAFKGSNLMVVGASGAIAGIMGAFYILFPTARVKSWFIFFTRDIPSIYYLFIWFLLNLARGFLHLEGKFIEPVAWWSHVGGFIAGALLVNLFIAGAPRVQAKVKVKTGRKR